MKLTKQVEKYLIEQARIAIEDYRATDTTAPEEIIRSLMGYIGVELPTEDDYVFTLRATHEQLQEYRYRGYTDHEAFVRLIESESYVLDDAKVTRVSS